MKDKIIDHDIYKYVKTGIIISTFTIFLIFILLNMGSILSTIGRFLQAIQYLFYGIVIAYILNQPMKLIESLIMKHSKPTGFIYKKRRGLSIILTIFLVIILIIILASLIIPNLIESLISLISNTSVFLQSVFRNIDKIFVYFDLDFRLANVSSVKNLINMPWQDMVSQLLTLLSKSAGDILENATNALSKFGLLFTGFIFSLYLLSHKETFLRQLRKAIGAIFGYKISSVLFEYAHRTNEVFSNFIGGQLIEACILWILYFITMRLFGFPYPELIATIIAIFSFVPFFGPITAMCVGAILILSKDVLQAIWFMVYFQVLSQLEDNLIYPKVVGNSVGLPGIWVLLSILAFGDLFGIFGIIVAVPTSACIYSLASELINKALKKRKLKITETTMEKIETMK